MARFEADCYCAKTFRTLHRHPENSYSFDTEEEMVECISNLIRNPQSGIHKVELTLNDFAEKSEPVVFGGWHLCHNCMKPRKNGSAICGRCGKE